MPRLFRGFGCGLLECSALMRRQRHSNKFNRGLRGLKRNCGNHRCHWHVIFMSDADGDYKHFMDFVLGRKRRKRFGVQWQKYASNRGWDKFEMSEDLVPFLAFNPVSREVQ